MRWTDRAQRAAAAKVKRLGWNARAFLGLLPVAMALVGSKRQEPAEAEDGPDLPAKKQKHYSDIYGAAAVADFSLKLDEYVNDRNPSLKVQDLQDLVLWCLTDAVMAPKWCFVKNKPLLERVVLVVAEGIGADDFEQGLDGPFKGLASLFPLRAPTRCPGDRKSVVDPMAVLLTCANLPAKKKNKKAKKREAEQLAAAGTWKLEELLLSSEQMHENCYPLPDRPITSPQHRHLTHQDFVHVASALAASSSSSSSSVSPSLITAAPASAAAAPGRSSAPSASSTHLLAIDCEMCTTKEGLELARVSVVDADERVLLDELVRPSNPIIDYNTRYSGITAEMLGPVSTALKDVQAKILSLIRPDTILVGHSLENDLLALRMMHERVVDTALLYPAGRGPGAKHSLRALASRYLSRDIQQGSHDSTQDAIAALHLVQHKLTQPRLTAEDLARPALFDVLAAASPPAASTYVAHPSCLPRTAQESGAASLIGCLNDEATTDAALRAVLAGRSRLVICHLCELARMQSAELREVDAGTHDGKPREVGAVWAAMAGRVERLFAALPKNSLCIVMTGHGSQVPVRLAFKKRRQSLGSAPASTASSSSSPAATTNAEDDALERAAAKARNGLTLFRMKTE